METGLQKLTSRIANRFPALARLAGSKSLLISGTIAAVSYASRFFDFGVRALDWAQRADFLRLRQGRILSLLQWFVSPTGSDLIFLIAVVTFFVAVILAVNSRPKPAPTIETIKAPDSRVTFEINENDSQVHITSGSKIRQIEAKIVLRCEKHVEGAVSVRAIHASLCRIDLRGGEVTVIAQERVLKVSEWPSMQKVNLNNGWTISETNSNFRLFHFLLSVEPKDQGTLSASYFLRVSMAAIGQGIIYQDIRVNNWEEAKASNSSVMLRGNYQGNEILDALSSENEALAHQLTVRNAQFDTLESDQKLVRIQRNRLKEDLETANTLNSDLRGEIADLTEQRTTLEQKLFNETRERQSLAGSYENSRREVAEARAEAAAQTRTYDVTFEGMKKEKAALKADLENANLVIKDNENQKQILDHLYQEEKTNYDEIRWVLDIIGKHAQHLTRYVVIELLSIVRVYLDNSTSGGPRIRCSFKIRNKSIFPEITVHRDQVKGCFSFRGKDLTERVKLDRLVPSSPNVDKLVYEQEGWIHLEQDLTSAETDRLKNALNSDDAIIGFEEIEIDVSGGTRFPDIKRTTLVIPEEFRRVPLKNCDIKSNTDNL